jgi:hypothetical protein
MEIRDEELFFGLERLSWGLVVIQVGEFRWNLMEFGKFDWSLMETLR